MEGSEHPWIEPARVPYESHPTLSDEMERLASEPENVEEALIVVRALAASADYDARNIAAGMILDLSVAYERKHGYRHELMQIWASLIACPDYVADETATPVAISAILDGQLSRVAAAGLLSEVADRLQNALNVPKPPD